MKIDYYINQEKRTVVCVITDVEYEYQHLLNNKDTKLPYLHEYLAGSRDSYLPQRFVGKAKCAPDDIWNEEFGRQLACKRAIYKYKNTIVKKLYNFSDALDNISTIIDNTGLDIEDQLLEFNDEINGMINMR